MDTIQLFKQDPDTEEREPLGTITEEQLDFLIDYLEEEFEEDRNYYIDQATIDFLKDEGADKELIKLLEKAVASSAPKEGVEIAYQRQ